MPETLFEELKRYVGFTAGDEAALRSLHPLAQPDFVRIAAVFYQRILEHEGARQALVGGEARVGQLKVTLVAWMEKLLSGPWDEAYFELRCRIGRMHVRIALPQHYMFGAMNVIRDELSQVTDRHAAELGARQVQVRTALGKVLDLELAIMLHTYREDLLSQQARTERLATFGQLVGSIGHELRNPLGVIETSLYLLKGRAGDDPKVKKHTERIGEQLGIANEIISDLLDMIRDRPQLKEPFVLSEVLGAAVEAVPRPDGVTLTLSGAEGLPRVKGDPSQLRQVFVNLIDNAVHAAGPKGEVRVLCTRVGPVVRVAVEDTGPGVDEVTRRRLFEPLITTKEKGIGLGLALVKRIVQRNDGGVAYDPAPGGGARFVVSLPAEEG